MHKKDKNEVGSKLLNLIHSYFWLGVLAVIAIPLLVYTFTKGLGLSFEQSGQFADTLGGTMGPIIAIVAAFFTFIAFWVQYEANQQQRRDISIERFESKFYNLLEIHRNNVNEIKIEDDSQGRDCFISLFRELKYIFLTVKQFYDNDYQTEHTDDTLSSEQLYNIAYLMFFFGIDNNSEKMTDDLIGQTTNRFFSAFKDYYQSKKTLRTVGNLGLDNEGLGKFHLDIKYEPFKGQMSSNSHYFRHLYNIVRLIDDVDDSLLGYNEKSHYAASLRSQISVYEQLLLYYNAVSVLGKPWLNTKGVNMMKKYCVVRSLPLPLADFYIDPVKVLGEKNEFGKTIFEWIEIRDRLKSTK